MKIIHCILVTTTGIWAQRVYASSSIVPRLLMSTAKSTSLSAPPDSTKPKKNIKFKSSKFPVTQGITLFDNALSPCARRVRMTLLEKGLKFSKVEVDLLKGDQLSTEYTNISPIKTVPTAAFMKIPGLEDCFVFESNVITELLDADTFGENKLYPTDPWERAQAKSWQDWEQGLADDFVPVMYQNVFPFVLPLRFKSRDAFLRSLPKEISTAQREQWAKIFDAQLVSPEKLELHAIACYQNLIPLEAALEGKEFLVGDRFTIADLSVLPRVAMFDAVGLTIPPTHFPNIAAYMERLGSRPCVLQSHTFNVAEWLMSSAPNLLINYGNWRSGRQLQRFDGAKVVSRVLQDAQHITSNSAIGRWNDSVAMAMLGHSGVLVADCPYSPNSWQIKLLLMDKTVPFVSGRVEVVDLIGRWAGSGGVTRIQHGPRCVIGIRAAIDYLALTFTSESHPAEYLPSDPVERARVQCWQAWDQTLGHMELGPLIETDIISEVLVRRYEKDLPSLMELQNEPQYRAKFPQILQTFICGLHPDSPAWPTMMEEHQEVVEGAQKGMAMRNELRVLLNERLRHLESCLEVGEKQGKRYLVGGRMTLADLLIFCRLKFFPFVGVPVKSKDYPNIAFWMAHLETHPSFKQVAKEIRGICQR